MKSWLKIFFAAVFTLQIGAPVVHADDGDDEGGVEVICEECVDVDHRPGDQIDVGGEIWVIDHMGEVNGVPMWEAHPEGPVSGTSFNDDGNDGSVGHDRITGRDFSGYEDDRNMSDSDRKELHELQQKIIARLNAETTADSEATVKELTGQVAGLTDAITSAGAVALQGPGIPAASMDPLAALQDSLQTKMGNGGFYVDQTGWQIYDDHSYQSDHAKDLNQLRDRLNNSIPKSAQQADAKRVGYSLLNQTDDAYAQKDTELGDAFLTMTKVVVDIATDLIPITSAPKDLFRVLIGKDPMSGESLANWERVLAGGFFVAGIITLGGSNLVKGEIRAIAKASQLTEEEIAIASKVGRTQEEIKATRSVVARIKDSLRDVKLLDPVKENEKLIAERGYTERAWDERKVVMSGTTKEPQTLVRFYQGEKDLVGSWTTAPENLVGKTPEEIKNTLALEKVPSNYTVVRVPPDTKIQVGFISPNNWGGSENAIQYFTPSIRNDFFGPGNPIGNIFRGIK